MRKLILVLLLCLAVSSAYDKSDYLTFEKADVNSLTHGCLEFEYCNPELTTFDSTNPETRLKTAYVDEVYGSVISSKWQEYKQVPVTVCESVQDKCVSTSMLNGSCEEYSYTSSCHTEYKWKWAALDTTKLSITPSSCKKVRYCAELQFELVGGEYKVAVDMVPSASGYTYSEYAWLNMSYANCVQVNASAGFYSNYTHLITINDSLPFYNGTRSDMYDVLIAEGTCLSPTSGRLGVSIVNNTINKSGDTTFRVMSETVNVSSFAWYYNSPSIATSPYNVSESCWFGRDVNDYNLGWTDFGVKVTAGTSGGDIDININNPASGEYGYYALAVPHGTEAYEIYMRLTSSDTTSNQLTFHPANTSTGERITLNGVPRSGNDNLWSVRPQGGAWTGVSTFNANTYYRLVTQLNNTAQYYGYNDDMKLLGSLNHTLYPYDGGTDYFAYFLFGDSSSGSYSGHLYITEICVRGNMSDDFSEPSYTFGPEESGNNPPEVEWVNLTPTTAYTDTTLNCSFKINDTDSPLVNGSIYWYLNGTLQPSLNDTYNNMAANGTGSVLLGSGNTSQMQNWSCRVRGYDGNAYSPYGYSNNVTIINRIPIISGLGISPGSPNNDSNLTCSFTATDTDPGDLMNASIWWYKDGVVEGSLNYTLSNFATGTLVNTTIDSGNTSVGEEWYCIANLSDIFNETSSQSSNVTILNQSDVTMVNVSLPAAIYSGGGVYCKAKANASTENVTIEYVWYLNGVEQSRNCYQENAGDRNCSTTGGGYTDSGNWIVSHKADKAYDANWTTYARGSSSPSIIYINYTKPERADGATWITKDNGATSSLTITDACWNLYDDKINLMVYSDLASNDAEWYCEHSAGAYTKLRDYIFLHYIYEEAINWSYSNDPTNGTNNTNIYSAHNSLWSGIELSGGDNLTCSARAYSNGSYSEWMNSSTVVISSESINITASAYTYYALVGDTIAFYANITNSSGATGTIEEIKALSESYWTSETWGRIEDYPLDETMNIYATNKYYKSLVPNVDPDEDDIKIYRIGMYAQLNFTLPDNETEIFESPTTPYLDYFNYFICPSNPSGATYCGNCTNSSCMTTSFTITLLEEETDVAINGTTAASFNASNYDLHRTFNYSISNQNVFTYYIWPSWANLSVDSFEQYDATGYVTRFRFYNDAVADSTVNNEIMYMINQSYVPYPTTIFVKDAFNNGVPWQYVNCLRYFPSCNCYKSVAMTRTNEDGEATVNLRYESTWWKFAVYNDGGTQVYITPDPMTITADPYPHTTIYIGTGNLTSYDVYRGISYNCTHNFTTTVITCDYVMTAGNWKTVNLKVRESGQWTPICDITSNATAGSIGCNITHAGGGTVDKVYTWEFIGFDPPPEYYVILASGALDYFAGQQYGLIGVFIAFLLFCLVMFAFVGIHPIAGTVGGVASLVVIYITKLVILDVTQLVSLGILVLIMGWVLRNSLHR